MLITYSCPHYILPIILFLFHCITSFHSRIDVLVSHREMTTCHNMFSIAICLSNTSSHEFTSACSQQEQKIQLFHLLLYLNAEEYFYFLCLLDVFEKQLVGIPIATIHAPLHEDFMVGLLKKNFVCPTYVLSLNNSKYVLGESIVPLSPIFQQCHVVILFSI